MLHNLHFHFQALLVSELFKVSKVAMTDHLVLVMCIAEENDRLSVLEARVHNLQLHKLACKLNW